MTMMLRYLKLKIVNLVHETISILGRIVQRSARVRSACRKLTCFEEILGLLIAELQEDGGAKVHPHFGS